MKKEKELVLSLEKFHPVRMRFLFFFLVETIIRCLWLILSLLRSVDVQSSI